MSSKVRSIVVALELAHPLNPKAPTSRWGPKSCRLHGRFREFIFGRWCLASTRITTHRVGHRSWISLDTSFGKRILPRRKVRKAWFRVRLRHILVAFTLGLLVSHLRRDSGYRRAGSRILEVQELIIKPSATERVGHIGVNITSHEVKLVQPCESRQNLNRGNSINAIVLIELSITV
jgi:hypothetical protein